MNPGFVLMGVILTDGGGSKAWLQEPTLTSNRSVPVKPGDSVGRFRVARILQDRVELDGPAGPVVVRLFNQVYGAGGTPAVSPGGARQAPRQGPAVSPPVSGPPARAVSREAPTADQPGAADQPGTSDQAGAAEQPGGVDQDEGND
jgi:hypothetical protein